MTSLSSTLEVLDLSDNGITSMAALRPLSLSSALQSLTLRGKPVKCKRRDAESQRVAAESYKSG